MFNASFTDVHGNVLTDAVVEITYVNYNGSHTIEAYSSEAEVNESCHYNLNYNVRYWVSQAAKDLGAMPMTFLPPQNQNLNINFTDEPDTSDVYALAQTHFLNDIIPNMPMAPDV